MRSGLHPRWSKILGDIWTNKTRTFLVVMSMTLGVAATGSLLAAREIIPVSLDGGFQSINPSSAIIYTDAFGLPLVAATQSIRGVKDAEGRLSVLVRVQSRPSAPREALLQALQDYDKSRVDIVRPESGAWPPTHDDVLVERTSVPYLGVNPGDALDAEMPDGRHQRLTVAGTVHDLNRYPVIVTQVPLLYVALPTLSRFLRQPGTITFNELHFNVAQQTDDRAHVRDVAARVRLLLQSNSVQIAFTRVPPPNQHFLAAAARTMLLLLSTLGIATLWMGGLLIVNTVSATLIQQTRQIAVMKSFGAETRQLLGIYFGMVLVFGTVAVALAVPISVWTTSLFVNYVVSAVNFNVTTTSLPSQILLIEVVAGLLVPLIAAAVPILRATRLSVREALSSTGLDNQRFGEAVTDRLIARVRRLPGPVMLSIRNAFRRKGRLVLTLAALILGGTAFISVLSVGQSLESTSATDLQSIRYDLEVSFPTPPVTDTVEHAALGVPGVVGVESWGMRTAYRMNPDGSESTAVSVFAPPPGSRLLDPIIADGRWLQSTDADGVVLGSDFADINPDLHVDSSLPLKLGGRESMWLVVGIARARSVGLTSNVGPAVFVPRSSLARATGQFRHTDALRVVLDQHDAESQVAAGNRILEALRRAHVPTLGVQTLSDLRAQREGPNQIVVDFLLAMAGLLTVVSGLGLAGTTSMNVLERTREIGVMRAIGASPEATFRIVVAEGLVVAVIGWLVAIILSVPASLWLSGLVARELVDEPVTFTYAWPGTLLWLAIAVSLAVVASLAPAWRAARMTVRTALTYE